MHSLIYQAAENGNQLRGDIFSPFLKFHSKRDDLSAFHDFPNSVDDFGNQPTFQLDLFLLDLKSDNEGSTLGGDHIHLGNQCSTEREIGDLPPDYRIFPFHGAGDGKLPALKLAYVSIFKTSEVFVSHALNG